MKKFIQLVDHLVSKKCVDPKQIYAFVSQGQVKESGKKTGNGQVLLRHEYEALLTALNVEGDTERFYHLLATVTQWMQTNAGQYDRVESEYGTLFHYEAEPFQTKTTDLDLTFHFEEDIHFVPAGVDFDGLTIEIGGEFWKLADEERYKAEFLESVEGLVEV